MRPERSELAEVMKQLGKTLLVLAAIAGVIVFVAMVVAPSVGAAGGCGGG
jgi:hypothetical protein